MKRSARHPEDMSAAELAEATKAFDKPFVFQQARPMNRTESALERRLRRGRPRVGGGPGKRAG